MDNGAIAELLSCAAEDAKPPVNRAMRRAARAAFHWPIEAAELAAKKCPLTELDSVGPFLEKLILGWLKNPPPLDVIPEIRQGFLTRCQAGEILAGKPKWLASLKGDLQMHTVWSDGTGTVEDMAKAAIAKGYHYIAITDHAKGLKIAGGINEEELAQQGREIAELNASFGGSFRVLRSIELNMAVDGGADLMDDVLAGLDIVLGAFHSALRKTDDQTERYLKAIRHPKLNILGHPRGRVYNYRAGLKADWRRVFATAAELDKAVEIDCYPDRQDLNVELLTIARREGPRISLGTDSHHPWQLEFMELGLAAAIKAGIPQSRILNFMPIDQLLQWAKSSRR